MIKQTLAWLSLCVLTLSLFACYAATDKTKQIKQVEETRTPSQKTLEAFYWHLSNATNAKGKQLNALLLEGKPAIQLMFKERRVQVRNTCNAMSGGYTLQAEKISFSQFISTRKMCLDEALNQRDQAVNVLLTAVEQWRIKTTDTFTQLILTTKAGEQLIFRGEQTPEGRYGNAGETIFLEVAAEPVACASSKTKSAKLPQCLRVRQVYFDTSGIQNKKTAEWQTFRQSIEGYQHENGIQTVLRVKRYAIPNPSADGADAAYILDMQVRSEVIKPAS